MIKLKPIIEKILKMATPSSRQYTYGCLMLEVKCNVFNKIQSLISDDDLNINEAVNGRENEPHITLLYGFHYNKVNSDKVIELVRSSNIDLSFNIQDITCFNNEEYDVLKFDVSGPGLFKLNTLLRKSFPHTMTFPEYKPHITIAYCKPGKGNEIAKKIKQQINLQDIVCTHDLFKYTTPDTTLYFDLNKKENNE